jgi:hypothetical protein
MRQHHRVDAPAVDIARQFRLTSSRGGAEMPRVTGVGVANRPWTLLSVMAVVTAVLSQVETANAMETRQLRREMEDTDERGFRNLMPILDGTYSNISGDYDYHCAAV